MHSFSYSIQPARSADEIVSQYTGPVNWPTFITSLGSAVVVAFLAAFLNPRFQHLFWKKQKLREQRVSTAERFAALHGKFTLAPEAPVNPDFSNYFEEDALLILVQVLFAREDTLRSGNRLKEWIRSHPFQLSEYVPLEELRELWMLRVDLLSRLFAEAFEIATDDLEERLEKRPGAEAEVRFLASRRR